MRQEKEKNFVSAVVYLGERSDTVAPFLSAMQAELDAHFEAYELICVNDACPASAEAARAFGRSNPTSSPLTLVNMSVRQGVELCMNAGIDMAIGDYIFEFDSTLMAFEPSLIFACYQKGQEGYDIVSAVPDKGGRASSRIFYGLFNRTSQSVYKLETDSFHVLSRRAVNRLHAINPCMAYRKAAYAASGLKLAKVPYTPNGRFSEQRAARASQAIDALTLYTNAAYKLSLGISVALLAVTLAAVVYTLVVYLSAKPIEGWTTTMLVMSAGFFGVFLLLTFIIKYLSLLVELVFKNQRYLVESVEKLQNDQA